MNQLNRSNIRLLLKGKFTQAGTVWGGIFNIKSKSHKTKKPSHKKGEETNGKF
jgi:hypothetical protein